MENYKEEISIEVKNAIKNCIDLYRDDEDFAENLGETLHENLSSNGIHAENEEQFRIWESFAFSLLD